MQAPPYGIRRRRIDTNKNINLLALDSLPYFLSLGNWYLCKPTASCLHTKKKLHILAFESTIESEVMGVLVYIQDSFTPTNINVSLERISQKENI